MRSVSEIAENLRGGGSAAHAYILEGKSREARDGFIGALTSALGCSDLDIVHMEMTGKDSYRTEDASAFSERLAMGAYGDFLTGVIDEADGLTEIVQNKLLKTIEEPHSSVVMVLGTSNPDHLLGTVRSRCMVIRASDYGFEDHDPEEAGEIAEAAALMTDGSAFCEFRDALVKAVKSKADALKLLDALEDGLREEMLAGEDAAACAVKIELAERTRADIERGMDRGRALKRLALELR